MKELHLSLNEKEEDVLVEALKYYLRAFEDGKIECLGTPSTSSMLREMLKAIEEAK